MTRNLRSVPDYLYRRPPKSTHLFQKHSNQHSPKHSSIFWYPPPKKQPSLHITSSTVIAPVKSLCESSSSSFGIFLPFFFLLSVCGRSPPTAGLALESICERSNKDPIPMVSFNSSRMCMSNSYQRTSGKPVQTLGNTYFTTRAIALYLS